MTQSGWLAVVVILVFLALIIVLPDFNLVSDGEDSDDADDYF
ncbi:MAG: hypothetical protein WDN02_06945 [Methylovirgula sp.]